MDHVKTYKLKIKGWTFFYYMDSLISFVGNIMTKNMQLLHVIISNLELAQFGMTWLDLCCGR